MRNSTSARDEELEAMKPKRKPKLVMRNLGLVTRKVFFLGEAAGGSQGEGAPHHNRCGAHGHLSEPS